VGGLGDVVTALGRAVQEAGNLVEVILPRSGLITASATAQRCMMEPQMPWSSVVLRLCTEARAQRSLLPVNSFW
jgi:starch synthase